MTLTKEEETRKGNIIDHYYNSAVTRDFQQCGILTSVDSGEPVQPPYIV